MEESLAPLRLARKVGLTALAAACSLAVLAPAAEAGNPVRYASPGGTGATCSQAAPCSIRVAIEGASSSSEIRLFNGSYDIGATDLVLDGTQTLAPVNREGIARISPSAPQPTPQAGGALVVDDAAQVRDIAVAGSVDDALVRVVGADALAERVFVRNDGTGAACSLEAGLTRSSVCFTPTSGPDPAMPEPPRVDNGPAIVSPATGMDDLAVEVRNVTAWSGDDVALGLSATEDATLTLDAANLILSGSAQESPQSAKDISADADGQIDAAIQFSNFDTAEFTGTFSFDSGGQQIDAPVFQNAPQGNFRQSSDSPTIDAGNDAAGDLGALDLASNDRVQSDAVDIGAYEDTVVDPPPDTGAPTVIITDRPRAQTRQRRSVFRFRGADDAGPFTYRCKLDRRPYVACDSPQVYARLGLGRHVFRVVATDPSGNRSRPTVDRWRIVR